MARSKSSKQSRLAFTPLPSSSPASKGLPKQVRDRAAAVSIDASSNPVRRRRIAQDVRADYDDEGDEIKKMDAMANHLPTPTASLEHIADLARSDSDGEDSDPIRSTQRAGPKASQLRRIRAKQQRLDFSNARDPNSFDSSVRVPSSSIPPPSSRAGMFGTRRRMKSSRNEVAGESSDEESDHDQDLPSPSKLLAKTRTSKRARAQTKGMERGEGKELQSSQRPVLITSDDGEGGIVVSSRRRRRGATLEETEDDMPTTTGQRPRPKTRNAKARRDSMDNFISSSPPRAVDSDDDVMIVDNPRKRRAQDESGDEDDVVRHLRKRRRQSDSEASEHEDEDASPTTPRRRLLKRPRQLTQAEKNDLDEDLDFLKPSDEDEPSSGPRSTQSTQKNARMQALQRLKQKRAGQPETIDEEDDGGAAVAANADDLDDFYDEQDDEEEPQITSSRQMFRPTQEDEDFIEKEPDDGLLGIPQGIPLHFTRFGSMKAKQLFKYAVEWMVQKKINPAFQQTDEIYTLTFNKLDDEVQGLAGSKFTSAAWTAEFTTVLKARPEIVYDEINRSDFDVLLHDKCDACNRSGHPATYEVQFQGKPYHLATLEDVAGNDEDDDSSSSSSCSSSESPDHDALGHALPPPSTIYHLGKFCMANARTAHALQHWRIHLNDWVGSWLDRNGHNAPAQVLKRDRLSVRKRRKIANRIADAMERDGVVKELYREFRNNIDTARESKQGRFQRGGSP